MPTDLERLTVLFEANTKSLENSVKRIERQISGSMARNTKSVDSLNKSFAALGRTASRAFGLSVGVGSFKQLAGTILDTVDAASKIVDVADKIGITTDALQELHYLATQNGASIEDMDSALTKFSKNIGLAAANSGPLVKILEANGIELNDASGKQKALNVLLEEYADVIKNAKDETAQAAFSVAAFGKGGDAVELSFKGGADAIRSAADEAHRFIQIKPEDTLRSLEAVGDDVERLHGRWDTALTEMVNEFLWFETQVGKIEHGVVDGINDMIDSLNRWIDTNISPSLGTNLGGKPDLKSSLERAAAKKRRELGFSFDDVPSATGGGPAGKPSILPPSGGAHRASGRNAAADAAKREHDQVVDLIAELERELSLVGKTDEQKRISNELHQAGAAATEAEKQKITELVSAIEAQEEAQQKLIDTMDTLRDAAVGALDAFAQSIQNSEGPLKAMKAALLDVLQTIVRIGEQAVISQLFGAFGTAGGGLAAPLLAFAGGGRRAAAQAVNVNVTASPSPLLNLKITQSAQSAEDRAVSRGPAVARESSRRYAIP